MRRLVLLASLIGCGMDDRDQPIALAFTADPGAPGSERYLCFGFDAALLRGAAIGAISLEAPRSPVSLHHVALFATAAEFVEGPVLCEEMPDDAVPMNVWATGGGDLELPSDLALQIPAGTQRLIVQAHALRIDDGPAVLAHLVLSPRSEPMHLAAWLPLRAPTPALRPHHREEVSSTCQVDDDLHIVSTWPHMHQAGAEFHGRVVKPGGSEAMLDVQPWSFDHQRAYPTPMRLEAGDAIETRCVWQNDTDTTILPGPRISDEMCGQSMVVWPAAAAACR